MSTSQNNSVYPFLETLEGRNLPSTMFPALDTVRGETGDAVHFTLAEPSLLNDSSYAMNDNAQPPALSSDEVDALFAAPDDLEEENALFAASTMDDSNTEVAARQMLFAKQAQQNNAELAPQFIDTPPVSPVVDTVDPHAQVADMDYQGGATDTVVQPLINQESITPLIIGDVANTDEPSDVITVDESMFIPEDDIVDDNASPEEVITVDESMLIDEDDSSIVPVSYDQRHQTGDVADIQAPSPHKNPPTIDVVTGATGFVGGTGVEPPTIESAQPTRRWWQFGRRKAA